MPSYINVLHLRTLSAEYSIQFFSKYEIQQGTVSAFNILQFPNCIGIISFELTQATTLLVCLLFGNYIFQLLWTKQRLHSFQLVHIFQGQHPFSEKE